jgi:hypothetical protein
MNTPLPPVSALERSAAGPGGLGFTVVAGPFAVVLGVVDACRLLLEHAAAVNNTMQIASVAGRLTRRPPPLDSYPREW